MTTRVESPQPMSSDPTQPYRPGAVQGVTGPYLPSDVQGAAGPYRQPSGGSHHPNVARWADLVRFFFGQVGYEQETDYALMVMWGESGGRADAVGPTLYYGGSPSSGRGLFQHMSGYWPDRARAASAFWQARGVSIGEDPNDPVTNIAVAAWLRAIGGWQHWAVAHDWYKPGAWTESTFWDGYSYRNMGQVPNTQPPRGDGQVAGLQGAAAAGGARGGGFINPLPGQKVTGFFGEPRDGGARHHHGTDQPAPEGTPIRATAGGRVVQVGESTGVGGLVVTIDHGNGWTSFYAHIQPGSFAVKVGDVVQAGDVIAAVGHTGNANGDHLHFEIRHQGKAINPEELGVFDRINPDARSFRDLPGETGRQYSQRDRLRAALLGSLDAISRSVAGGNRVPLPGQVTAPPAWTGASPDTADAGPASLMPQPQATIVSPTGQPLTEEQDA